MTSQTQVLKPTTRVSSVSSDEDMFLTVSQYLREEEEKQEDEGENKLPEKKPFDPSEIGVEVPLDPSLKLDDDIYIVEEPRNDEGNNFEDEASGVEDVRLQDVNETFEKTVEYGVYAEENAEAVRRQIDQMEQKNNERKHDVVKQPKAKSDPKHMAPRPPKWGQKSLHYSGGTLVDKSALRRQQSSPFSPVLKNNAVVNNVLTNREAKQAARAANLSQ